MLLIPSALRSQIETARTHYYATCWRITPVTNPVDVVRVTDWPEPVQVAETANGNFFKYSPAYGAEGSASRRERELKAGGRQLRGLVTSELISAVDLAGGRYDGCRVDEYVVDARVPWAAVIAHASYWISTTTFDKGIWTAELRDVVSFLNDPVSEQWGTSCRVDLYSQGPGKCNLSKTGLQLVTTVDVVVSSKSVFRPLLGGSSPWNVSGYATEGTVEWLSGNNTGATHKIKTHIFAGPSTHTVELHAPAGFVIQPGDQGVFLPGCNHLFGARDAVGDCINKFNNGANFQGEPFVPGRDKGTGGIPSL